MPLAGLVDALTEKTNGRVLQADVDYQPGATQATQAFHSKLRKTPLFFECAIPI